MKSEVLVAIAILVTVAVIVIRSRTRPSVSFGIITRTEDGQVRFMPTTLIPFRPDDPAFEFGPYIRVKRRGPVKVRLVHHLPSRPLHMPNKEHAARTREEPDGTFLVESPSYEIEEVDCFPLRLHAGDPQGQYRLDVFVNDRLNSTVVYKVGQSGGQ